MRRVCTFLAAAASAAWGVRAESATPPDAAALPRVALRLRAPHTAAPSKEKPLFENPLISPDGPDPTVWDGGDGWFYALTTPVQKMHRSRNLVDWEAVAHDPLVPSARLALTNVTSYVWAPCVVNIAVRR